MCCNTEMLHIFLWSAAVPISILSIWTLNSPRWGRRRWKDGHNPDQDGICYSGKWYPNEWGKGMLLDIVHPKEMELKFHLQHLPKGWMHSLVRSVPKLWRYSFSLHLSTCFTCKNKHCLCQGEKFCKCARNYPDPCETDIEKGLQTVWSPRFSIWSDGSQTKEMSFYSFSSFALWHNLLLVTCLKNPSELIYVAALWGSKPSRRAWRI